MGKIRTHDGDGLTATDATVNPPGGEDPGSAITWDGTAVPVAAPEHRRVDDADGAEDGEGEVVDASEPDPLDAEDEETDDDYEAWPYANVQAECRKRHLNAAGSKGDLVARLRAYDREHEDEDERD